MFHITKNTVVVVDTIVAPYGKCRCFLHGTPGGGGGGGVLKKVLYGEAPPRGPTPYPFIYHFFSEKAPLSYTFYWKKAPL